MKPCTVQDIKEVSRVMSHAGVFSPAKDDSWDDSVKEYLGFFFLTSPAFVTFMPDENTVVVFQPKNYVTYELHIGVIPGSSRKKAVFNTLECVKWMVKNTHCKKLIANIPVYRKDAIMYALMCGMIKEGVSEAALLKDGILHDCLLLGTPKETMEKFIKEHRGGKSWLL